MPADRFGAAGAMIPAVIPLILIGAGLIALVAGGIVLASFGPRLRVGRLLASTPRVTVAEAAAIARGGMPRYVRVDGRIDAENEFEDADHRPLVLRRTRIEARAGRGWRRYEDNLEAVPFEIREGLDSIAVDGERIRDGLVVVPRESDGVAGDLGERAPDGVDPSTPVRAIVEQVSSVEHATVLGVPVAVDGAESMTLTAGLGRPLVLTTLEPAEAMRIIAGGSGKPRLAAACLGAGLVLLGLGLAWLLVDVVLPGVVPGVLAASPSPATGGDPRSSGEGPGLVGDPLRALAIVGAVAVVAIGATLAWIRLTGGPGRTPPAS